MCLIKPVWFDYIEWDYTDKWDPRMKGFREDTPEEIKRQYYRDQKYFEKARRQGYDL